MEEQQQQVQVQPHLKCPRCDSSNTKFCYYNNYSLSQPRHLCKSCKRYWTRGGTLRNVPVGGKCRKNKRDTITSSMAPSTTVQSSQQQVDVSSSTATTHPLVCSKRDIGKDLSFPQFCMGGGGDELVVLTSQNLSHNLKPPGDDTNVAISNQLLSGYPLFGISSTTTTSSTTMASVIASSLDQQNMMVFNGFKESSSAQTPAYGFLDLDDVQMMMRNGEGFQLAKYAKMEGHRNTATNHNYVEEMNKFSSDPPFMWNSSAATWLDSSNIGSSLVP